MLYVWWIWAQGFTLFYDNRITKKTCLIEVYGIISTTEVEVDYALEDMSEKCNSEIKRWCKHHQHSSVDHVE